MYGANKLARSFNLKKSKVYPCDFFAVLFYLLLLLLWWILKIREKNIIYRHNRNAFGLVDVHTSNGGLIYKEDQ
jgi:hypothetical protein